MDSRVENLRSEFLRILEQIEIVTKDSQPPKFSTYDPSKYESCVKIKGRPILPPVMTEDKKEACLKWREEALRVEERLALKRRQKYVQAVKAIKHGQVSFGSVKSSFPPSTLDSVPLEPEEPHQARKTDQVSALLKEPEMIIDESSETLNVEQDRPSRERKLSYTLEEPSPVLLAYMQRFGQDSDCGNPRCHLEDYLADLSKAPKVGAVRHSPPPVKAVEDEPSSPEKENVPPMPTKHEWAPNDDVPSPLKIIDGPTWAKSPNKLEVLEPSLRANPNLEVEENERNRAANVPALEFEPAISVEVMEPSPRPEIKAVTEPTSRPEIKTNMEHTLRTEVVQVSEPTSRSEVLTVMEPTPRSETIAPTPRSEIMTVDSSLMESMTLTLPPTTKSIEEPTVKKSKDSKRSEIEAAVTALALQQQKEIQRLMEQQARDREQLRQLFEEQQRQLIESVLSVVSSNSSKNEVDSARSETTLTLTPEVKRPVSPVIPTVKPKVDPSTLILPQNWSLPEDAKTPVNNVRFEKLSALVKGHLTRRLLKTAKVQSIILSMKDIMSIALQLHREGHQYPRLEDVQLHSRLLQQLQRESHAFHDIFFKYTTQQKMNIIRIDREIKAERETRPTSAENPKDKRRISAVTLAKLQQKQQIQAMLDGPSKMVKLYSPQQRKTSPRKMTGSPRLLKGGPRRSLNFGERSSSATPSLLSSPRQAGKYPISTNKSKIRKTGVKSISHAKPWK